MYPKDKIPTQLHQDVVYIAPVLKSTAILFTLENPADAWKAESKTQHPIYQCYIPT